MEESELQVLSKIYKYCAYQERCKSEVIQKMNELGIRSEKHPQIIQHLIEERFLDENRYLEIYIGGKFRVKKWGRRKIIFELKKKQVAEEAILRVLNSVISSAAYTETIKNLAIQKDKALNGASELQKKSKIIRYLLQKGYESEWVYPIVMQLYENRT